MLIGMTGLAGSGKDTVAQYLAERYDFAVISFADPLYQAVSAITGITVEKLHDRTIKEQPIKWLGRSPRELLQSLGTEWGRKMIHENIWVSIALERIATLTEKGHHVVVTDVRFDNEAMAIKLAGGLIWRVSRPGVHACVDECADHDSEKGVSDALVDDSILNDSTIDYLRARADFQLLQYKYGQDAQRHF